MMDAQERININVVVLESGAKLIWLGEDLPVDFFNSNNITFSNILKRVEEMKRYGMSVQK